MFMFVDIKNIFPKSFDFKFNVFIIDFKINESYIKILLESI